MFTRVRGWFHKFRPRAFNQIALIVSINNTMIYYPISIASGFPRTYNWMMLEDSREKHQSMDVMYIEKVSLEMRRIDRNRIVAVRWMDG